MKKTKYRVIIAMRISSFFYTLKQGVKNIWSNRLFSLASIATMSACIFLFGLFYSIVTNFQAMVKNAEEGVAVTAFFDEGISEEQIKDIGNKIEKEQKLQNLILYLRKMHGVSSKKRILREMRNLLRDLQMIIH